MRLTLIKFLVLGKPQKVLGIMSNALSVVSLRKPRRTKLQFVQRFSVGFLTTIIFLTMAGMIQAQEAAELRLSLSRDFGFGLGNIIQGTFSYEVSGPADLERVIFLLDGKVIGEDNAEPFTLQFRTENYSLDSHVMSATGYTRDGLELQSNIIQRQFVSGEISNRAVLWIIIPIIVLSLGGRVVSAWIAGRGDNKTYSYSVGPLGGTICPKCGQPFSLHIWGLNVVAGKFDRCPHCGKWSLVRRVSSEMLSGPAEAMPDSVGDYTEGARSLPEDEDTFHQQLEDSRFDE